MKKRLWPVVVALLFAFVGVESRVVEGAPGTTLKKRKQRGKRTLRRRRGAQKRVRFGRSGLGKKRSSALGKKRSLRIRQRVAQKDTKPEGGAPPVARLTPPSKEVKPQLPAKLRPVKLTPTRAIAPKLSLPPREDAQLPEKRLASIWGEAKRLNLDLQILRERMMQAELLRARTWSILKPTLNLNASYTRNQQPIEFNPAAGISSLLKALPEPFRSQASAGIGKSKPVVLTPQDQLAMQLQLRWAFLNLRSIPLLEISYLTIKQIGETAKRARRELMYALARSYYGVLLTSGLIDISRESVHNATEHLKIAQARVKAGVAPALTVTRARLDLVRAKQQLLQARNGLRTSKQAVALLLNKPRLAFRPVRPARLQMPEGDIKDWVKQARNYREDLKASRVAIAIADKQISDIWFQYLPTVALLGNFQWTNASGFAGQNTQWNITLAAQLNLYDGGAKYNALREAMSKRRQAQLELAKKERQVQHDIVNAQLSLKNTKATLKVAREQLALAEEAYQLTQVRYKSGVATPLEVSDSLTAVNSAKISVLRESLNAEVAILGILRAIGIYEIKP